MMQNYWLTSRSIDWKISGMEIFKSIKTKGADLLEFVDHLSEVRGHVESLQKTIHVASSTLVLEAFEGFLGLFFLLRFWFVDFAIDADTLLVRVFDVRVFADTAATSFDRWCGCFRRVTPCKWLDGVCCSASHLRVSLIGPLLLFRSHRSVSCLLNWVTHLSSIRLWCVCV